MFKKFALTMTLVFGLGATQSQAAGLHILGALFVDGHAEEFVEAAGWGILAASIGGGITILNNADKGRFWGWALLIIDENKEIVEGIDSNGMLPYQLNAIKERIVCQKSDIDPQISAEEMTDVSVEECTLPESEIAPLSQLGIDEEVLQALR